MNWSLMFFSLLIVRVTIHPCVLVFNRHNPCGLCAFLLFFYFIIIFLFCSPPRSTFCRKKKRKDWVVLTADTRVRSVRRVSASKTSVMSIYLDQKARAVSIKLVRGKKNKREKKKRKKLGKNFSRIDCFLSAAIFHRIVGLAERLHQLKLRFSRKKKKIPKRKKSTNGCGTKIRIDGGVSDAMFFFFFCRKEERKKKLVEKIALVLLTFSSAHEMFFRIGKVKVFARRLRNTGSVINYTAGMRTAFAPGWTSRRKLKHANSRITELICVRIRRRKGHFLLWNVNKISSTNATYEYTVYTYTSGYIYFYRVFLLSKSFTWSTAFVFQFRSFTRYTWILGAAPTRPISGPYF